jgi:flagellar biosynthesis protein FliR
MTLSEPEIGALIATLARASGLAVASPVISEGGVSTRARLVFVVAITAAVGINRPPVAFSALAVVAPLELAIGLVTGFIARTVMSRVAIAGQLMGLSLGLGFAAQYDVHAGESAGVLRTLTATLASLAFITAGGFEAIVTSAAASPAAASDLAALGPALVHHATSAFGHGLALASPILLAALVGNVALAVMNRAAPAVNVFSVALAVVLILGGLALLASAAHLVAGTTDTARTAIDVLVGH